MNGREVRKDTYNRYCRLILFSKGVNVMNKKLKMKTEEWMALERVTFEQRKAAEEFYEENLMELIKEDFLKRNKDDIFEEVEHLVISVGTSYEPIVLNISLLSPKHILFLYTDISEQTLNKVIQHSALNPSDYEKRKVSAVDPLDIYREVKNAYLLWNKPEKMYIDITGGTKTMSAAAALAGAIVDVQLVYVSTDDYMVDFRKPRPGSEQISYIENPLAVFGDLEIDKAYELMREFNFQGAKEKLETLKEIIPEPETRQELEFSYLLANTYENWDALNFETAEGSMQLLYKEIQRDRKRHPNYLMMDFTGELKKQLDILMLLKEISGLLKEKYGDTKK